MEGVVIVNGYWGTERTECCILNVYAPCLLEERIDLWGRLKLVIDQNEDVCTCLAGDLNSIRFEHERSGVGEFVNMRDIRAVDDFIIKTGLFDLPLHGRKYTCYRPNGKCKSRLDRFLVNNEWLQKWPESTQKGLPRSISDHCPILLETKSLDWGPRPFRFLNAWIEHPNFKEMVSNTWKNTEVEGWAGYVVKEKLKSLNESIRDWNQHVFGMVESNIEKLRKEIEELDVIDDTFGLEDYEVQKRRKAIADLFTALNWKNSICSQKARMNCLKDGDINSNFFHRAIRRRRKINEMVGIQIGQSWVDQPEAIKKGVKEFFMNHFRKQPFRQPSINLTSNKKLSAAENLMLTAPFSEQEIRNAIDSCESSKSPGPDGF